MTENRRYYETVTTNHTKEEENSIRNERSSSRSSTTSSITTTRARANKKEFFLDPETKEFFEEYYADNLGGQLPSVVAHQILNCCAQGMDPLLIQTAIDETMLAARPSPRYLMAILRRWLFYGVLTSADLIADQERHEADLSARYTRRWRKTLDHQEPEDSVW